MYNWCMKFKRVIPYLLVLSLVALPAVAQGNSNSGSNSNSKSPFGQLNSKTPEERATQYKEKVEDRKEAACEKFEERLSQRIRQANLNHERHRNRHQNVVDRISALLTRLEEEGYDVTDLKDSLTQMNTLIGNLGTAHDEYIASLEAMQDLECGDGSGSVGSAVHSSRAELKEVRDILYEIRQYFQETVKPEIIAMREQIRERHQNRITEGDVKESTE
jgi:vacuolar-type H+-ATPase subunit I/STV1